MNNMSIVGFNFSKMLVERKNPSTGKVNIKNNVQLRDVEEAKLAIDTTKKALKFTFTFSSIYEPNVAVIELDGELITIQEEKDAKDILASWKKDKKLDRAFMNPIMNHLLAKCNIQALILSRELGLPAPIPLPRIAEDTTPEPTPTKKK
ncbi:MAG: hypothetical protein ABIA93_06815 [Candidatus Woesearchaeota archaeon]